MLASSSKAPPPVRSSTQTKDVAEEAIQKSQRLHAELTEVRVIHDSSYHVIQKHVA